MIIDTLIQVILFVLGIIPALAGTILNTFLGVLPIVFGYMQYMIEYWNTFLGVAPFMRLPFYLFTCGIGLEIFLLILKFILGSRVPSRD